MIFVYIPKENQFVQTSITEEDLKILVCAGALTHVSSLDFMGDNGLYCSSMQCFCKPEQIAESTKWLPF